MDEDDDTRPEPQHPGFYTVAVVMHDKAFGGHEEGGWYYDTYEVLTDQDLPKPAIFTDHADAKAFSYEMDLLLEPHNEGRPDVSSVLSRGRYCSFIFDGFPRHIPETRPRYE